MKLCKPIKQWIKPLKLCLSVLRSTDGVGLVLRNLENSRVAIMALNSSVLTIATTVSAMANLPNITNNTTDLNIGRSRGWNMSHHEMCIPLAVHQFPKDLIGDENRKRGGILVHLFAAFYIFGCLAYLCDCYFVPALEVLTDRLKIQPEVAGATFMAIGSSSPELFASLIGVYVAEDDVGVGTIIGSAVFNILFVIGFCIIVSPTVLCIDVYPIVRDAAFYTLSLIPLAAICMDGEVDWYDAVSLVLLYGLYIFMMYHSTSVEKQFYKWFPIARPEEKPKETTPILDKNRETGLSAAQAKALEAGNGHVQKESNNGSAKFVVNGEELEVRITDASCEEYQPDDDIADHAPFCSDLYPPTGKMKKVMWLLGLPVIVLYWLTIPDASKPRWTRWFPLTFIMSLVYIAGFSYLLVYMVTIIGYTVGVPDIVMGLIFMACGASVPDALASIIVAKHGKGRMSISNCIGSNIFDILLGLGIPWMMKTLFTHYGHAVPIISGSIKFTVFILIGSVVAMLFVFWISRWKLRWPAGVMLIVTYLGFMTVSCLFEMNVFGRYNLPQCD